MIFIRETPGLRQVGKDPGLENGTMPIASPTSNAVKNAWLAATPAGSGGPLKLEQGPCTNPLFGAFSMQRWKRDIPRDVNGYQQEGFGPFDRNVCRAGV